jgi:hypothetical protein
VEFFLASQVESLPPANTVLSLNGFRLAPAPRGYPFQSNRFLAQAFDNKRTARDLMTEDRSKQAGNGKESVGTIGGSKSSAWNTTLAEQLLQSLWVKADAETCKKLVQGALSRLARRGSLTAFADLLSH